MKTLRCMAYQQNGVFVAACIDLSLAAQADTMQDAMKKLDEQIKDYLVEAYSEPAYTEQLLNRKAPLSMRLKYFKLVFKFLFSRQHGPITLFREPCQNMA
ncbi:DUF1902 domain-containing protein [Pectobacterium cacticida]|uniref:DUF1902 domain-containing protein n=1 Tax=Pectobacterium cacticida TaxID=69221 RepID=UPI0039859DB2